MIVIYLADTWNSSHNVLFPVFPWLWFPSLPLSILITLFMLYVSAMSPNFPFTFSFPQQRVTHIGLTLHGTEGVFYHGFTFLHFLIADQLHLFFCVDLGGAGVPTSGSRGLFWILRSRSWWDRIHKNLLHILYIWDLSPFSGSWGSVSFFSGYI